MPELFSFRNSLHLNHQVKALELLAEGPQKIYKLQIKNLSSSSKVANMSVVDQLNSHIFCIQSTEITHLSQSQTTPER